MLDHDDQGTGPAVVLVHAGIADRRMWADLAPVLASQGYRVIAVDLPGFGESSPASGPQAPWSDLLATLDALEITSAALVGASFGGAVAVRAAALHRGRFWAQVLLAAPAPGIEPSQALLDRWAAEEEPLERGDLDAATEAVVDAWLLPSAPQELREQIATMQYRALELQGEAVNPSDAPDPLADPDLLTGIAVPTLVITGEQDLVDFTEGGKLLARLLPDADLVTLPLAGHLPSLEQPATVEALLTEFLAAKRPQD